MNRSNLTFLFILLCFIGKGQTYLTGKVTDEEGAPLAGVSVYVPDQSKGTLSNQDGEYSLEQVPLGKVVVQFSCLGYNTAIKSLIIEHGKNELNVLLTECSIEMSEVVVSGGKISSQRDNAVKIDVIRTRKMQLLGTPNLMEALADVPGVDMIAKGPGVSKPVIRGLSMNGILIARDGIRIENYQYSENHPAGIDDNGIGRVEIIKGPASLLYGSDAVGGVINFISETPAPQGKMMGDYQMQAHSNTLGINNSLGLKGASKHFFAGIRLSHKTHSDYLQGGGTYVPNSRFHEWSSSLNTGYKSKIGTFKLSYYYFKQQLGMTLPMVVPLIKERSRKNEIWYQDPHHHLISSRNKLFFGKMRCDVNVAWQSNVRSAYNVTDVPFVEMKLNTLTYETKIHLPSNEKSDYTIGIQGMEQVHRNINDRMQKKLPDADISRLGVLFFAQYTFFSKLKLQGGCRLDLSSIESYALGTEGTPSYRAPLTDDFISPNGSLGATYRLNERATVRANFAKACRMPNLRELLYTGLSGNRYEIAGENLKPEDAYESDFSFHYQSKSVSVDVAVFNNQIKNYIYLAPTADTTGNGVGIYKISQSNAKLYGGEAGLHYHPSFIPWLHLKTTFSSVIGKQKNGKYLPFIPAHKLKYEAGFEKKTWWVFNQPALYLGALTAMAQNNPSQFETETDGYTIFNVRANAKIKISNQLMVVGVSVNNVFDESYIDHLSTLKFLNYYNQGRNICLSLKVPFGIK
ncbi:TonB-dependent receptor [Marinilabiliaceae bacterium JC017]|nr:TonB-dependent receptor [Marinilabiliaceae bacterium JC017]